MARENEYLIKFTADTSEVDDATEKVKEGLNELGQEAEETEGKLSEVGDADMSGVEDSLQKVGDELDSVSDKVLDVKDGLEEMGNPDVDTDSIKSLGDEAEESAEKTGRLSTAIGKIKGAGEKASEGFGKLKEVGEESLGPLDELTGGLPSKFLDAFKGVKKFTSGMKLVKIAIASTGIGLLVIALGSLAAALAQNEEFMDRMKTAMSWMEGTFNVLKDLFVQVGESLMTLFTSPMDAIDSLKAGLESLWEYFKTLVRVAITPAKLEFLALKLALLEAARATKEFFGGDATELKEQIAGVRDELNQTLETLKEDAQTLADPFIAMAEGVVDAVTNIGNAIAEESNRLEDLRKANKALAKASAEQAYNDQKRANAIAELNAQLQELNETAEKDISNETFEKRKELLEEINAIQMKGAMEEANLARERLRLFDEENKGKKLDADAYEERMNLLKDIEQAEGEVVAVRREKTEELRAIDREQAQWEKEQEELRKERLEELQEELLEKEERQNELKRFVRNDAMQDEIDDLIAQYEEMFALADEFGQDTTELQKRLAEEQEKIKEEYRQAELEAEREKNQELKDQEQELADFRHEMFMAYTNSFLELQEAFGGMTIAEEQEQKERLAQIDVEEDEAKKEQLIAQQNRFIQEQNIRAKKQFEREKALKIAMALADTYKSATSAYQSQFVPLPDPSSPVRGAIAAGVAVTQGLANVQQIRKLQFDAEPMIQARPSSSGGGRGGSDARPPQLDLSFLGEGSVEGSEALRAYVVESNVTSAQQSQQLLEEQAVL